MDSKFIQEAVQKWLYQCDHIYQACNFKGCGYEEADILAVTRSLMVTEIEVKISISDYKADFKKKHKHYKLENPASRNLNFNIANKFYYASPEGLINEVPSYAGLLHVTSLGEVICLKSAPRLHTDKAADKLMIRLLENLTSKIIWGCQYMTYQNRLAKAAHEKYLAERKASYDKFMAHAANLKQNKV